MTLRLLADDLTGALDSAAMFASSVDPIRIDLGTGDPKGFKGFGWVVPTRERDATTARAMFEAALPRLEGASRAFLKLDSLLRGPWPSAIAAAASSTLFDLIVIAPAFPAMGRVTRQGQTFVRSASGAERPVGPNIFEALRDAGVESASVKGRVVISDAETDTDLARLVAFTGDAGTILWCGSAGLAQAAAGKKQPELPLPPGSSLAIIGSHHPVTRAQIAAVSATWPDTVVMLEGNEPNIPQRIATTLTQMGRALIYFALPEMAPDDAAAAISDSLAGFLPHLAPPDRLVAGGGETLMAICKILGATALDVSGTVCPGMPLSRFVGGCWDGVTAITKSGAFGDSDKLRKILESTDKY